MCISFLSVYFGNIFQQKQLSFNKISILKPLLYLSTLKMIKNKKSSYFQSQRAGINNLQSNYSNKITDLHIYDNSTSFDK